MAPLYTHLRRVGQAESSINLRDLHHRTHVRTTHPQNTRHPQATRSSPGVTGNRRTSVTTRPPHRRTEPQQHHNSTHQHNLTVIVVAHTGIHRTHNLLATGRRGDIYRLIHNRARRSRVHTPRRDTRRRDSGCTGPINGDTLHIGHGPVTTNKERPAPTNTRTSSVPEARTHRLILRHTPRHSGHIHRGTTTRQHPPTSRTIRLPSIRGRTTTKSSQTNHHTSSSTHHLTHINHPLKITPHTGAVSLTPHTIRHTTGHTSTHHTQHNT